jgi:DHA1 family bicyclomycin/chloramphenicol resistance-like MFS transporter
VQLVACRFLQGIGACVGPILGRAIVRDLFDRHHGARMLSHMTMVMSAAPLLAPILGGYLLDLIGWQAIFAVLGTAGALILAVVVLRLGESLAKPDLLALRPGRLYGNYRVFFTSRTALGFSAVATLLFCGLFTYISAAPYVFIEVFGVRQDNFGYFFAIPAISLVSGGFVNASLLHRFSGERLMQAGLLLVLTAGLTMLGDTLAGAGIFGVVLPIMAYVFGVALIMPNAMAAAMEPHPAMAGIVSSLIGCLQMAGAAFVGWVASQFYDHTPLPMAISVLAMGGGAFLVYHLFVGNRPDARAVRVGA